MKINDVNEAPDANADRGPVGSGQLLTVGADVGILSNDTDEDMDPLVMTSIFASNGTMVEAGET